jgi:putative mycofactocin binding protein MftB
MQTEKIYRLCEGVQVRKETFGLLFYNYRGPRLYFVPTKDSLQTEWFADDWKTEEIVKHITTANSWPQLWVENWVNRIIALLEIKGLIHGQSIC